MIFSEVNNDIANMFRNVKTNAGDYLPFPKV
jgi:hypothetical protein